MIRFSAASQERAPTSAPTTTLTHCSYCRAMRDKIDALEAELGKRVDIVDRVERPSFRYADMSTADNVDKPKRDWAAIKRKQRQRKRERPPGEGYSSAEPPTQ